MSAPEELIENAVHAAKLAIKYDQEGEKGPSAYYYQIAAKSLEQASQILGDDKNESIKQKGLEYQERAKALMRSVEPMKESPTEEETTKKVAIKQCYFLLQQAIEEDEHGDKDDAIELYAKAVEYCTQFPDLLQGELKGLAMQALERAETLKGIKKGTGHKESSSALTSPDLPKVSPNMGNVTSNVGNQKASTSHQKPTFHRGNSVHLKVSGQETYSDNEKAVLLHTSRINGRDYVPFMSIDLNERFQYSIPFTDKDGQLALAPKQRKDLYKFVRPQDICSEPCIVHGSVPNYLNIKQTVISDCSFVASLAVSAHYEAKFGRKLVTSIIYPQSKDRRPLYNPFGKYMIKLHINGIPRKVIIDDHLPIDRHGRLLCSYSSNKNEFWISLLEKAYMKVMGGYDFPGSNSNIDLHALTGWIPERVGIRLEEPDFNKDTLFKTLETRMANGDVLVSVATGELSESDAERSGLVATHAYAVMDVKTVNGVRLLKLKNPWSHLRWRGNYSELDTRHWTPELQKTLNYDPHSAAEFDNGVFWIDYDSVLKFFDVFYMNWNPELFKYTYCIHQMWHAGQGPAKDLYTISSNPQFSLNVSPDATGAVWILLSRHITDIEDFRNNKEFITVFVYKGGRKVYFPYDPSPFIDGVKINSPHYLCKIILGPTSAKDYTIVVSQYEKSTTIYYTLRAYATCPFRLNEIIDPYTVEKQITGQWKGSSAGGCPNHQSTYPRNPKIHLEIQGSSDNNQVLLELKGPKQYQIGLEAIIKQLNNDSVTAPFKSKMSGPYRSGYTILELPNVPSGTLELIPSTFLPGQEGPFILVVKSSAPFKLYHD
ncbi:calpain-7-like [Anthonomus grandis grandis]|uniref:calpain-7-like n=1 Tax=Anthonomus grandis grandis TaxID=2921223 RepID=UPI0021668602|nr:calpain-7-like [Anthonomus grandis grandis]